MANLLSVNIPLSVYEAPSVEQLLANEHPHFEYCKTYQDSGDKLVAIHTSGSTGIPKPIYWTLETANRHMRMVALDPPEGFEDQHRWSHNKRLFLTLPPFHAGGLATILFIGIPAGITIIASTSGGLPTATALVEARKQTPFEVAFVVPSIIHELAQSPGLLDYCSQHLEYIMYAGGDLPQAVGNAVASKIKLVNQYGATEVGMLSAIHSLANQDQRHDWRYIHFHPDLGAKLNPVTEDEYELVMVHSPDCEPRQMHSSIFGPRDYSTRDLWVRHPDPRKSDLWRWSSRADDVIVFLNGEKTNPVSMEQHIIASNHEVAAVVVAGAQRFQASLIIELGGDNVGMNMDASERAAAIETIWPSIEEANRAYPAHARISRTHILFTTPDKPMLRAGKGTVQRAGTLALYSAELDALYTNADQLATQKDGETSGPGRVSDLHRLAGFIQQSLSTITGWSEDQLSTENFFSVGLDSLQTITAARRIKRGLNLPSFTPNLIYLNPSVAGLAQATLQLIQNDAVTQEQSKEALLVERDALRVFTEQIRAHPAIAQPRKATNKSHVVVLTGSTGTLGTYILNTLLQDPSVTHVHCLTCILRI